MRQLIDLDRFPLDALESSAGGALVENCRSELIKQGMFSLKGFLRPQALAACLDELLPRFADSAFTHRRSHNIYFKDDLPGLAADHPALKRFDTINHTLCADQIPDSVLCRIYNWTPLLEFLAAVLGKPQLYTMADPLARTNVMAYRRGEALNWHFDRAEFTTTLLLQAPESGGVFQYRRDLRAEGKPNYDGVARLLADQDEQVEALTLAPGTLNVFKGKYTAHRVTPVEGERERIVAVLSYYETPGVLFSAEERLGFYGRRGPGDARRDPCTEA